MPTRQLDKSDLADSEDWYGNNVAFTCPSCGKVFLVSGLGHGESGRSCPKCKGAIGHCDRKGERAWLEW